MSSNSEYTQVHTFSNDQTTAQWPSVIDQVLEALRPHLPTALSLYRRLQFGRFTAYSTIITNLEICQEGGTEYQLQPVKQQPHHSWLVAYVDRSCRPETEAFIYGIWETEHGSHRPKEEHIALMRTFAHEAKKLILPPSQHPEVADSWAASPGDITFGAVHEKTATIMREAGVLHVPVLPNDGISIPFGMYIFQVERQSSEDDEGEKAAGMGLPAGLRWGRLQSAHLAIVRARQPYPRLERTMATMPDVALFSDGQDDPIAWALIGLDGSLTSLHVEEDWRKRGLGVLVAQKIFHDGMAVFWKHSGASDPLFAHAYVAEGNIASESLLRKAEGVFGWNVHWIHTNLAGETSS
jgi:hypothetical protein